MENNKLEKDNTGNYRHGDLIIRPATIPVQATEQPTLRLVEGEATGHHHSIVSGDAIHFRFNDKIYLRVRSDICKIDHPEHGPGELPQGDYEIGIKQEWKETGWTKMLD